MDHTPFILIVDDNPKNLQVLGNILSEIDCQIGISTNGKQAVATANSVIPDLILMDIEMPIMDGYTATQKLKEIEATKDIPIIFLTAKKTELLILHISYYSRLKDIVISISFSKKLFPQQTLVLIAPLQEGSNLEYGSFV